MDVPSSIFEVVVLIGGLFAGVAAIPTALALALHFRPVWRTPARGPFPRWFKLPHRPTAFPTMSGRWVRVMMPNGRRVAGWVSAKSFVSNYPQPRDLCIQEQFEIGEDGEIGGRVPGTAGVWLSVVDGCIVEWLDNHDAPEEHP